jgi:hypothetical protein
LTNYAAFLGERIDAPARIISVEVKLFDPRPMPRLSSALIFPVSLLLLTSATGAHAQITVGTEVNVSRSRSSIPHAEMLAAADPANAKRLLACTMAFDPGKQARSTSVYSSFDGGKSWVETLRDTSSRFVGDPTCVYGFGDTAYASTLVIYRGIDNESWMSVFRSTDGGRKWKESSRMPFIDRQYLVVDRSNGPYTGRVYLTGNEGKFHLLYSTDGGSTFTTAQQLEGGGAGSGIVLDDGNLVVPYRFQKDGKPMLGVIISRTGGTSVDEPIAVIEVSSCQRGGSGIGIELAVDRSGGPFDKRLYLGWPHARGERCEVLVAHSDDGGRTWSAPVSVVDDRESATWGRGTESSKPHASQPSIVVNKFGVLGVSWYDRRQTGSGKYDFQPRFTASTDGGETFLSSVALSSARYRQAANREYFIDAYVNGGGGSGRASSGDALHSIIGPDNYYFRGAGDTRQMVAGADGAFHPFWSDNRTGVMQLWTVPVTVAGKATLYGDPSLDGYVDITSQVTLWFKSARHDPGSGRMIVDAALVNKSESPISGTVKMRVVELKSPAADIRVVNSDNGRQRVGAIWDLTDVLPKGRLEPRKESRPFSLSFHASGVDAETLDFNLISLKTRVFAKPKAVVKGRGTE